MANTILEIKNLSKSFNDNTILKNINLTVKEGDIYGLLGKNGAGKSTTMKVILRLIKADKGTVRIFDEFDIAETDQYLSKIGSLIESPSFYPNLTAIENLTILQRLTDIPEKNIQKVLEIVGLEQVSSKKLVKNYSLGMKQRLGIALALLKFPKLIILDEPTNGLDPQGVLEIRELIQSLPEKYGTTVLISSHILSEIEKVANRVAIINNGEIKFEGSIKELRSTSRFLIQTNQNDMALEILKKNNFIAKKVDRETIKLENIDKNNAIKINTLLMQHQIGVCDLHTVQNSLEDVFMKVTEG
ncbi:ABC transporter ATP-binding protein [Convivina intestini]|uniref:ABC transporter ATP-binding protein n=1 Tax=Convivina intestini TaxID=1505726 RepID=UPI00200C8D19|nr:ABC transporter ATP-binding protein [Convivina intestini]CAH1852369.1 Bacitracin transport ATP-binding protein BcrA [Convivina intestini]